MEILIVILLGALAGWLAATLYKGSGFGILGNIVIGLLGSVVGYWLLRQLNISLGRGWVGVIFTAMLGALVILFLANLIFRSNRRNTE